MNEVARKAPGSLRSKSRLRLRHTTLGLRGELDQAALAELGDRLIRLLDQSCVWVLLDFGDFVVHVFDAEVRGYYGLERLWGDAPRVEWEAQLSAEGAAT